MGYGLPVKKNINFAELSSAMILAIMDLKVYLLRHIIKVFIEQYNDKDDTPVIAGLNAGDSFVNAILLCMLMTNTCISLTLPHKVIYVMTRTTAFSYNNAVQS